LANVCALLGHGQFGNWGGYWGGGPPVKTTLEAICLKRLVADAVGIEPVSGVQIPCYRPNNRDFPHERVSRLDSDGKSRADNRHLQPNSLSR
jgi:hypothetical protein